MIRKGNTKMDEKLEVIVQQEVGVINWNFEQLKTAVAEKMKEYDGKEYTEETVPVAKADVAMLRKLKKSVAEKRIEIKKKCMEPYEVIESQAAELTALLDKPIDNIDGQLKEYEAMRRDAVKSKILAYMEEKFIPQFPNVIASKLRFKIYDEKWENATCSMKTWKQAIDKAVEDTKNDISAIKDVEEEFYEAALNVYAADLSLADTMNKVSEMRRQKEMILAKEREKIAAEERAKAQAEAMKTIQDRLKENEAMHAVVKETYVPPQNKQEAVKSEPNEVTLTTPNPELQKSEYAASTNSDNGEKEIYTLRISATRTQIAKIKGYIEYSGAAYREV